MNIEQIIINLETLMEAVKLQPEAQFNLSLYKEDHPCGTIFCSIGLAASMPYFMAKGFGFALSKWNDQQYVVTLGEEYATNDPEGLAEVFGPNAFQMLFTPSGTHHDTALGYTEELDHNYVVTSRNMSEKALAILRLENRIAEMKEQA